MCVYICGSTWRNVTPKSDLRHVNNVDSIVSYIAAKISGGVGEP